MWQTYHQPASLEETLRLLQEYAGQARVVAGGTDLIVEVERGIRPTATVIDISRLPDLKYVRAQQGQIRLGALATHNDVLASDACAAGALPLAQACLEVGAPQIRTRGTVAGNVITGYDSADGTLPSGSSTWPTATYPMNSASPSWTRWRTRWRCSPQ